MMHLVQGGSPAATFFSSFADRDLGALVDTTFGHDPGYKATRAASDAFWSAVRRGYGDTAVTSESEALEIVRFASREALDAIRQQRDRGPGGLSFTVLMKARAEWVVVNLGANVVLRLSGGLVELVVEPQSIMRMMLSHGVSLEYAASFAGGSAVAVAEGVAFESEIRARRIALSGDDWLLVAPGSEAAVELRVERQPQTLADVAAVVERLARRYVQYSRSWLAIGPGE